MGYRSDVVIVLHDSLPEELFVKFYQESPYSIIWRKDEYTVFLWEWVKWYENIEACLRSYNNALWGFVRSGEEIGDYDTQGDACYDLDIGVQQSIYGV